MRQLHIIDIKTKQDLIRDTIPDDCIALVIRGDLKELALTGILHSMQCDKHSSSIRYKSEYHTERKVFSPRTFVNSLRRNSLDKHVSEDYAFNANAQIKCRLSGLLQEDKQDLQDIYTDKANTAGNVVDIVEINDSTHAISSNLQQNNIECCEQTILDNDNVSTDLQNRDEALHENIIYALPTEHKDRFIDILDKGPRNQETLAKALQLLTKTTICDTSTTEQEWLNTVKAVGCVSDDCVAINVPNRLLNTVAENAEHNVTSNFTYYTDSNLHRIKLDVPRNIVRFVKKGDSFVLKYYDDNANISAEDNVRLFRTFGDPRSHMSTGDILYLDTGIIVRKSRLKK